jgi:hypothetical protein
MMNGVAAQTRRFQAVATIKGVPYNKMIVSPVRSNVCLSRFDLQRGSFGRPGEKGPHRGTASGPAGVGLGRRRQGENLRTLDTRNTLRTHNKSDNANGTYEAKRQAGAGSYCERSDEAV